MFRALVHAVAILVSNAWEIWIPEQEPICQSMMLLMLRERTMGTCLPI